MSERENWLTALRGREIDGMAIVARMAAWAVLVVPLVLLWLILFSPLVEKIISQDDELDRLARLQAAYETRLSKSDTTQEQQQALETDLVRSVLIWKVARRQDAENQMQAKLRQLVINAHGKLRSIQIVSREKVNSDRPRLPQADAVLSVQKVQTIALKASISFRETELSAFIEKLQAARPLLGVSDLSIRSTRRPAGTGKPPVVELHLDLSLYGFVWERI